MKGRGPGPLDDGGKPAAGPSRTTVGDRTSIGPAGHPKIGRRTGQDNGRRDGHVAASASRRSSADALDAIPAELAALVDNVVVLVEDDPPADEPDLLGVYDGTPLTERGRAATRWRCRTGSRSSATRRWRCARAEEEVVDEVRITVVHEIAHHFGIDDDRLHDLGYA